jgi:hypothetical protein
MQVKQDSGENQSVYRLIFEKSSEQQKKNRKYFIDKMNE